MVTFAVTTIVVTEIITTLLMGAGIVFVGILFLVAFYGITLFSICKEFPGKKKVIMEKAIEEDAKAGMENNGKGHFKVRMLVPLFFFLLSGVGLFFCCKTAITDKHIIRGILLAFPVIIVMYYSLYRLRYRFYSNRKGGVIESWADEANMKEGIDTYRVSGKDQGRVTGLVVFFFVIFLCFLALLAFVVYMLHTNDIGTGWGILFAIVLSVLTLFNYIEFVFSYYTPDLPVKKDIKQNS